MGNRSIGTAAAGGMLIGPVFGVLVIPGLYVLFSPRNLHDDKVKAPEEPAGHPALTLVPATHGVETL